MKKIFATLGFCVLMTSSSVESMNQLEVANGFGGMDRDAVIHLLSVVKTPELIRTVIGMCQRHLPWICHNNFVRLYKVPHMLASIKHGMKDYVSAVNPQAIFDNCFESDINTITYNDIIDWDVSGRDKILGLCHKHCGTVTDINSEQYDEKKSSAGYFFKRLIGFNSALYNAFSKVSTGNDVKMLKDDLHDYFRPDENENYNPAVAYAAATFMINADLDPTGPCFYFLLTQVYTASAWSPASTAKKLLRLAVEKERNRYVSGKTLGAVSLLDQVTACIADTTNPKEDSFLVRSHRILVECGGRTAGALIAERDSTLKK